MKLFASLMSAALLWQTISAMAPQKTTFDDAGVATTTTTGPDATYPDSVIAPEAADGSGPVSDPFPKPHTFTKSALLNAYHQSVKQRYSAGDGATYPKPWVGQIPGVTGASTEFPILVSGAPYAGGDPGRFRILVGPKGEFHKIVMHQYSDPKHGSMSAMSFYGNAKAVTKRDEQLTRRAVMEEDYMLVARDAFHHWLDAREAEAYDHALAARMAEPEPQLGDLYARDASEDWSEGILAARMAELESRLDDLYARDGSRGWLQQRSVY
ncbi:hypothetical protein MMC19_006010 [Ptychographa xylographoides]|nr:hypothetical protein [Ptychographa xylographoides]